MCYCNKRILYILILLLINFSICSETLYSQSSNYNNSLTSNNRGSNKNSNEKTNENSNFKPLNNNESNNTNQQPNTSEQKSDTKVYDPFIDNHLKAPPEGITIGKFGKAIKEVEKELRYMGAKDYSYAFGKFSKMTLSSYIITLEFDVNKRLGLVEITPKPPLKTIETKAKDFFISLFTENSDLSQIGIVVSPNKLQLRYINLE